jgi:hypothetical protein
VSALSSLLRGLQNRTERLRYPCRSHVVFVHMPKCGGTTVVGGLKRCFPQRRIDGLEIAASYRAAQICDRDHNLLIRDVLAYKLEASSGTQLLTGHWVVDAPLLEKHTAKWRFVTVLREPVERWISNYFYDRYKPTKDFRVSMDLEEFLETEHAAWYGSTYVRHLAARRFDVSIDHADVALACENLRRFACVGFLSDLAGFTQALERRFSIRVDVHGRKRQGPVAEEDRRRQLTPAVMQKIQAICAPDTALYEFAEANLWTKDLQSPIEAPVLN